MGKVKDALTNRHILVSYQLGRALKDSREMGHSLM